MEKFSVLLALCAGNSPVTSEFPSQRPVTRSIDVFFDMRLNRRLSKQSRRWWFETSSRSSWRHCNVPSQSSRQSTKNGMHSSLFSGEQGNMINLNKIDLSKQLFLWRDFAIKSDFIVGLKLHNSPNRMPYSWLYITIQWHSTTSKPVEWQFRINCLCQLYLFRSWHPQLTEYCENCQQ